ncbi:RNA polymerase sigma factor [Croceicoccus sp. Ery15]|uniref:RNA polymerase sigma factor n=1 Tax=Croceicoccus sp. Ery15 TaxID=1703338 RepID=UPI001E4D7BC2|nr:RNA polymerase sigma factor [Croceicoccus sp. Ery15]
MTEFISAKPSAGGADNANAAATAESNAQLAGWLCESDREHLIGYLSRALRGNRALAEDMTQEALTRIVVSGRRYVDTRARGLLYTIARNLLTDHYREEIAQAEAMQTLGVIGEDSDTRSPLHDLVAKQDVDRVRTAILALPPRCGQVFVLNRYEHMSYSAIARHFDISVSAVEKHIARALRHLVEALEDAPGSDAVSAPR